MDKCRKGRRKREGKTERKKRHEMETDRISTGDRNRQQQQKYIQTERKHGQRVMILVVIYILEFNLEWIFCSNEPWCIDQFQQTCLYACNNFLIYTASSGPIALIQHYISYKTVASHT